MCRYFLLIMLAGSRVLSAQTFTSSNLPIIVINTNGNVIVDDPKITVDIGVIYNGPGLRNSVSDPFNNFQGKAGIEIRGSSSQFFFPKKQYGLELIDQLGGELDASLLGLPPESDWVLFAPYNDKTLMRDVLAYEIANRMSQYAPRTKYCELVINGQYQGVYVLIEKIKRNANRVDVNKLDPTENSGDALTGGYIIKIDKLTDEIYPGWISSYPPNERGQQQLITFLYEYPKPDQITHEQREYIQTFMADFERTLSGQDYKDPIDGYSRYIDTQSFVEFFIVNEITKNVDGYRLSTFMYKQRDSDGGKLAMGPVWDFNLGFGNADYCEGWTTTGFAYRFNAICNRDWSLVPFWWDRLMTDVSFKKKLSTTWSNSRAGNLSNDAIFGYIDSVANVLTESRVRNFQRWPVLGQKIWPNYYVGNTYEQEVTWLKNWIASRMLFLDAYFGELVTSAGPHEQGLDVVAYPNPAETEVTFEINMEHPSEFSISMYDLMGREVQRLIGDFSSPGLKTIKLGATLPAGTYFYRLKTNRRSALGKIVKK